MAETRLPLEGIRVVDITVVWAGPYATQLLADWGAEVIRVEPIELFQPLSRGGRARPTKEEVLANKEWGVSYPDWDPGLRPWNRYPAFNVHARNKKSVTVNINRPEGAAILNRLIAVSDVLLENNVPVTSDKLGLCYERLSKINPALIMVRMPGFGLEGPYRGFRCLGSHIDGISGHTWVRGYPDLDLEAREDVYFSDAAGGANGALAVMMALRYRRRTGRGQLVELAQVENFTSYISDVTMDYMMNGRIQSSLGNRHPYMVPHGCYPCKGDDQWVVIGVVTEEQWSGLCEAMGNPDWTENAKFSNTLGRMKHQDELDQFISQWTEGMDKCEVMETLQRRGVAAAAVLDHAEVHQDPHFGERKFFQPVTQRETGTHRYPSIIAKMSKTPNAIRTPPVRLGEHNDYVYRDLLGLTDDEYQRLKEGGHIGTEYHSHVA